jgi:uncharacterized membrane protein
MPSKNKNERQAGGSNGQPAKRLVSLMGIRVGPLPPPAEMEKYERLHPGVTKLLLDMFREQAAHRMELEKTVVKGDNRRANIAQWLSFILGMTALGGGVILILKGRDGFGFASIIGALTTLLGAFFGGAILRKLERQEKDKPVKT